MLKRLRGKLGLRDVAVVKLALWSGLVVWMVFFFSLGAVLAPKLADPALYSGFGSGLFAEVLAWVAPIWVVFTALLVVVYVARFANKRLGRKKKEEEK